MPLVKTEKAMNGDDVKSGDGQYVVNTSSAGMVRPYKPDVVYADFFLIEISPSSENAASFCRVVGEVYV